MNILIIKLGATGDVVRTTPLLERLGGRITWITAAKNMSLLDGLRDNLRSLSWEQRQAAENEGFDLVINLEDTAEVAQFVRGLKYGRLFGAFLDTDDRLAYSEDSCLWFDMSLISRFGRKHADHLKLQNRRTYQELIFEGLGLRFNGETYKLPEPAWTSLTGDVAIAAETGPVWPMKTWAYYEILKVKLQAEGLVVNVLPRRDTLLEHLADVRNHLCLVGGDSLPMHFALGTGTHCVTLFNCTSPWEIHDYGIQQKIVSPLLADVFYQRNFDRRATMAISLEEVYGAVKSRIMAAVKEL